MRALPACVSRHPWVDRYEELRGQWLQRQVGWGQALFLRQGMASWMKAWSAEASRPEAAGVASPGAPWEFSGELRCRLTSELVNLILHRQEEMAA